MKYPNVLFFRHESYAAIDDTLKANRESLDCTLNFSSDPNEILKLFDCNYHILVTFGATEAEYYPDMGHLVNRIRLKWIHFTRIHDFADFSRGINFCYIHNVLLPREVTRPVFSVFTTCYNSYQKFLRPYESLKVQTLKDWEWVVLDDSPDEAHFDFLKGLVGNDPRVRLYRRASNSGNIGNVKNEVVSLCRGTYVLELDHDDEILPDCLTDAVKAFETDPDVGFVYMDTAHLYENRTNHSYGDHFGLGYCGYYRQKYKDIWVNVISSANINNISMSHIVGVPNHPRIWKRSVLNTLGNYSEYLPICDDQEILMRTCVRTKMARVHKFAYIQYMNDGWNNFSLIRNSEINRLGPNFIVPQGYANYKINEHMKTVGAFEEHGSNPWERMWKKPNFEYKYCNSVLNFDFDTQYCILGKDSLLDNIDRLRELYDNKRNDFFVLDNHVPADALCGVLDEVGLSRMKCYSLEDCSWEELCKYFHFVCRSTANWEFIGSDDRIPHRRASEPPAPQVAQEGIVDVAFDQSPRSLVPV